MTPQLDDNPQPWLAAEAVAHLERALTSRSHVLEFGAGNSSVWLAERCGQLVSVESALPWAALLVRALKGADHVSVIHVPPDETPHPPFRGARGKSYRAYVEAGVSAVADELGGRLDLLLVDGRARVACIRACAPLVRPGGLLVLDNADRPRYAQAPRFLIDGGWEHEATYTADFGDRPPQTAFWRRSAGT